MNTVEQVSAMQIELDNLRSKDEQAEEMIALLKSQNELMSMEISKMASDHANEVRRLKQRCDLAVRHETEIGGILNTVAVGILSGLRKMKGDETPEQMPERPGPIADHSKLPPNVMPGPDAYAPKSRTRDTEDDVDGGIRDLVRRLPAREAAR